MFERPIGFPISGWKLEPDTLKSLKPKLNQSKTGNGISFRICRFTPPFPHAQSEQHHKIKKLDSKERRDLSLTLKPQPEQI